MNQTVKDFVKFLKLCYLWVTRILFAPNHFNVSIFNRIKYAILGGYMVDQVVLYDFAHNDRKQYLSEFDWYRSRWINEPFDPMLNNKVVCTELLRPYVSVPHISFIKNKGRYFNTAKPETLSTLDEAIEILKAEKCVFLKPIGAGKGKGVYRLDALENDFLIDMKTASSAEVKSLLAFENNWLFSSYIEQSTELNAIFSETSNTIRFITIRNPESGRHEVLFAVLRIGTAKTVPVDNGSRGGLVAMIDLETGTLSEARSLWSLDAHKVHPDSKSAIEGVVIPKWDELKVQMIKLAQTFPYLNFIAWDILLTDSEPCIIEANTSSGVNIIQLWGAQRNGALGDFYRAHKVIK